MSDEFETWKTKVFKLDEKIEALEKLLENEIHNRQFNFTNLREGGDVGWV